MLSVCQRLIASIFMKFANPRHGTRVDLDGVLKKSFPQHSVFVYMFAKQRLLKHVTAATKHAAAAELLDVSFSMLFV
jgi:hypothetical protein